MASIDGLSLATDILLPLGGTLAVAGIVMVLVGKNKDGKNRDVSMAVTPLFSQSYGGFAIEGRF